MTLKTIFVDTFFYVYRPFSIETTWRLVTSFNDGVRLAKEAATRIDQQKKEFQRTGLDTLWKQ